MLLVLWLLIKNSLVYFFVVLIEVRRETNDELVQQSACAVNIRSSVMALTHEYFRAHVLGRATERVRSLALRYNFRQSKISNLNVAIDVNKYILRLDVSIHNFLLVQVLETEQQLSKVELRLLFCELLDLAQVEEHFTAGAQVHDEE